MTAEVGVEAKGDDGAYYPAYVRDILDDDHVIVSFENNVLPEQRLPFSRVRLPPPKPTTNNGVAIMFSENTEVEVFYSPISKVERKGWWLRKVWKTLPQAHNQGEFLMKDPKSAEVLRGTVRLPNTNPPITKFTFHKVEVPLPANVVNYLATLGASGIEDAHREFQRLTGAGSCRYNPTKKVLCVISASTETLKKVDVLKEMHIRKLTQQNMSLKKKGQPLEQPKKKKPKNTIVGSKPRRDSLNPPVSTSTSAPITAPAPGVELSSSNYFNAAGLQCRRGVVGFSGGSTGIDAGQLFYCGSGQVKCDCQDKTNCNGICGPQGGCPCSYCLELYFELFVIKDSNSFFNDAMTTAPSTSGSTNNANIIPQCSKKEEDDVCVICWVEKKSYALVPCGHLAYCKNCVQDLKECAVCRVTVETKVKIFEAQI